MPLSSGTCDYVTHIKGTKGSALVAKSTITATLWRGLLSSMATVPLPVSRVSTLASRFKREAIAVVCLGAKRSGFHMSLTRKAVRKIKVNSTQQQPDVAKATRRKTMRVVGQS